MERYFDIVLNTMFKINKKVLSVVVAIVGLIVIIFLNFLFKKPTPTPSKSAVDVVVPSVVDEKKVEEVQQKESYTPYVDNKITTPKYNGRPLGEIRLGKGFEAPQELISKHTKELAVLATALNKNPLGSGGVADWIAVGVIKKFFNDYEGARDAWEYAGVLYPHNALSFANLGSLYGFYLNDKTKAEFNYGHSIQDDPYQPSYYLGLADFYSQVDTINKSKVPEVILAGLQYIQDPNMLLYLANFYKNDGDKANAVKYYQEVLKVAPGQAGIKEEIEKLQNN